MFQESLQVLSMVPGESGSDSVDAAEPVFKDRYMYGSPLTPVGAFQMLAEEALRDGDIDARDNAILRVFVRGFDIDPEDARDIADVAREKQRLGHLHVRRPFDRLKLYKRMLRYSMAHTGEDEDELALLARYRKIFKIDESGEAEIRRSARADLRMTESTMIPPEILALRDVFLKKKSPEEESASGDDHGPLDLGDPGDDVQAEPPRPVELKVVPRTSLDETISDLAPAPDFMRPETPKITPLFPEDRTLADVPAMDSTLADAPAAEATFSDRTLPEDTQAPVTPVTEATLTEIETPAPRPRLVAPPPVIVKPVPLVAKPSPPKPPLKESNKAKSPEKSPASKEGGSPFANLPGRDQALSLATGFGILIMLNLLRVFIEGRVMPAWPFAGFALCLVYATVAMASETEDGSKK